MANAGDKKVRLLIIDDQPEIRGVLRGMLGESYDCVAAASAEEALVLLQREEFDLVISDINLGGMSGLEMIPRLRAIAPDTVVMMISGEQTIESAIEALRVGAYDYITKPFDLFQVETAVRRASNTARCSRQNVFTRITWRS
jgi:DNA-binding NtrC family response regulator